jgi:hypothetical protein
MFGGFPFLIIHVRCHLSFAKTSSRILLLIKSFGQVLAKDGGQSAGRGWAVAERVNLKTSHPLSLALPSEGSKAELEFSGVV